MRILRLHIENFGTLHDYDLELQDGLHVIHEENGWGKSTLAAFIKAMFYGLPRTAKRSLAENDRRFRRESGISDGGQNLPGGAVFRSEGAGGHV